MADTKTNKSNQPNVLFIAIDDLDDVPEAGQVMVRRTWHKWMSEELYDHQNDGQEFHNLADREAYVSVKRELVAWLPKHNAEPQ